MSLKLEYNLAQNLNSRKYQENGGEKIEF